MKKYFDGKELFGDNFTNEQIDISKKLDEKYLEITQNLQQSLIPVDTDTGTGKGLQIEPDSPRGVWDNLSQGGFSKKRTIRKRTNKKRTIRKRTNKKKTIKKKIKRTIYKTRKTR